MGKKIRAVKSLKRVKNQNRKKLEKKKFGRVKNWSNQKMRTGKKRVKNQNKQKIRTVTNLEHVQKWNG